MNRLLVVDHQRFRQPQLLDGFRPALRSGVQRELQKRRAREHHDFPEHVVGEPGMGLKRDTAREYGGITVSQRDHRAQQRMLVRSLTKRSGIAAAGAWRQPVVLVLEGVGGEWGVVSAGE